MESDLKQKPKPNKELGEHSMYKNAHSFAKQVIIKYNDIFSSVLVRRSDKDQNLRLIFIIDDFNNIVANPDVDDMRIYAKDVAESRKNDFNCSFILVSDFWPLFQANDQDTVQLVRDSFSLFDKGFFLPLQELLVSGKVRPTKESVRIYFLKSQKSIKDADSNILKAIVDLYWAVIDCAHAAVMVAGVIPPSPEEMAATFKRELVLRNLIHKRCAEIIDDFYTIAKKIMHKEIFRLSGREFDKYLADAEFFISEVDEFIEEHVVR